jgi:hypothetical protein
VNKLRCEIVDQLQWGERQRRGAVTLLLWQPIDYAFGVEQFQPLKRPGCGHDFMVAFSCKGRGLCPSCNARRMAETAAHLVDHVIPPLPVRQWVLSVPKRLRWPS